MTDPSNTKSKVVVLPPDQSMQRKLGDTKIDKILSVEAVKTAQEIIVQSSTQFLEDSQKEMKNLEAALNGMNDKPEKWQEYIGKIIDSAFTIKSQAAQGGYDLISTISKSLLERCEVLANANLSPANIAIIEWHVESLKRLLALKVKGSGGPVGEAILAELEKLATIGMPEEAPKNGNPAA